MEPDDIEEGYEWVLILDKVPLPEFVEQSAKGEMKMVDGKVHVKSPIDNEPYYDDYWDYQDDIPDSEELHQDGSKRK